MQSSVCLAVLIISIIIFIILSIIFIIRDNNQCIWQHYKPSSPSSQTWWCMGLTLIISCSCIGWSGYIGLTPEVTETRCEIYFLKRHLVNFSTLPRHDCFSLPPEWPTWSAILFKPVTTCHIWMIPPNTIARWHCRRTVHKVHTVNSSLNLTTSKPTVCY